MGKGDGRVEAGVIFKGHPGCSEEKEEQRGSRLVHQGWRGAEGVQRDWAWASKAPWICGSAEWCCGWLEMAFMGWGRRTGLGAGGGKQVYFC